MRERGSAGASAQAEHHRRLARHEEHARRRRPYLLAFATGLAIVGIALVNLDRLLDVGALPKLYATAGGWIALGLAVAALIGAFATPRHVTAWATGADGERRTEALLKPLESEGFRVLHDRRIPNARSANIDHIVIGPPGAFVIDGIPIDSGRDLVRRLRTGKPVLSTDDVTRLAGIADARLRPAASDCRRASVIPPR